MALSVLHKKSLSDDKNCGVWCSKEKRWVFNGTYDKCFSWKNSVERDEQSEENLQYFAKLAAERKRMGIKS